MASESVCDNKLTKTQPSTSIFKTTGEFMTITKEEVQAIFECKKIFYFDGFDFEQLTQQIYGKRIEILESANDTTHEFSDMNGELDEYDQKTLDNAIRNGYLEYYSYRVILNDLVKKQLLEPGDYFMRISW